jgi:CRISPR-associated protein Csb2
VAPSPWRILRALIATWRRTVADLPQDQVEAVLRRLARPPEFVAGIAGHTCHFMPWFRRDPPTARRSLTRSWSMRRDVPLVARWPDASLDDGQTDTLLRILST